MRKPFSFSTEPGFRPATFSKGGAAYETAHRTNHLLKTKREVKSGHFKPTTARAKHQLKARYGNNIKSGEIANPLTPLMKYEEWRPATKKESRKIKRKEIERALVTTGSASAVGTAIGATKGKKASAVGGTTGLLLGGAAAGKNLKRNLKAPNAVMASDNKRKAYAVKQRNVGDAARVDEFTPITRGKKKKVKFGKQDKIRETLGDMENKRHKWRSRDIRRVRQARQNLPRSVDREMWAEDTYKPGKRRAVRDSSDAAKLRHPEKRRLDTAEAIRDRRRWRMNVKGMTPQRMAVNDAKSRSDARHPEKAEHQRAANRIRADRMQVQGQGERAKLREQAREQGNRKRAKQIRETFVGGPSLRGITTGSKRRMRIQQGNSVVRKGEAMDQSAFGVEHVSKGTSPAQAASVARRLRRAGVDPSKYKSAGEARKAARVYERAARQRARGVDTSRMTNYQSKATEALRPVDNALENAGKRVSSTVKDVTDNASKTVQDTAKNVGQTATKTVDDVGQAATKQVSNAATTSGKKIAGRAALRGAGYTAGVGTVAGASRLSYKAAEKKVLGKEKVDKSAFGVVHKTKSKIAHGAFSAAEKAKMLKIENVTPGMKVWSPTKAGVATAVTGQAGVLGGAYAAGRKKKKS